MQRLDGWLHFNGKCSQKRSKITRWQPRINNFLEFHVLCYCTHTHEFISIFIIATNRGITWLIFTYPVSFLVFLFFPSRKLLRVRGALYRREYLNCSAPPPPIRVIKIISWILAGDLFWLWVNNLFDWIALWIMWVANRRLSLFEKKWKIKTARLVNDMKLIRFLSNNVF